MSDEINKGNESFGTPSDYFGRSAQNLFQRLQWVEEIREFPRLSELKNNTVFSVPENYFSKNTIRLELIDYSILNKISNKELFTTPEDYFETNSLNSQLAVSSGTNKLKKTTEELFSVPSDYFEKKSFALINKLEKKKRGGKVISLRRGMKYSMAAALLIVLSIWIYNLYFGEQLVEDCGTIACVDRQDVVASKNFENFENDELYELVNTAELKEKLENEGAVNPPSGNDSADNNDLDELYDDI